MIECKHDGIATYRLLDGTPAGMWGCTQCAHKFVPIAEKRREHEAASLKAQSACMTYTQSDIEAMCKAAFAIEDGYGTKRPDAYSVFRDGFYAGMLSGVKEVEKAFGDSSSDRLQQFGSM